MPYTFEEYQKASILHPLIEDALSYAIENLSAGWSQPQKAVVKQALLDSYGLSESEASAVLESVVIGLMRANRKV
jgi:hypothetical protein